MRSVYKSIKICIIMAKSGDVWRMPELDALAERIIRIRNERHETQEAFAYNCGISTEELSLIERKKTDPKLSTLQSIAAYTGNSVSELLRVDG